MCQMQANQESAPPPSSSRQGPSRSQVGERLRNLLSAARRPPVRRRDSRRGGRGAALRGPGSTLRQAAPRSPAKSGSATPAPARDPARGGRGTIARRDVRPWPRAIGLQTGALWRGRRRLGSRCQGPGPQGGARGGAAAHGRSASEVQCAPEDSRLDILLPCLKSTPTILMSNRFSSWQRCVFLLMKMTIKLELRPKRIVT